MPAFSAPRLLAAALAVAQAFPVLGQTIQARRITIQQAFRQVEQMPLSRPWTPASVGGVLQEGDGVRTLEKSSTELRFDHDSRLILSEDSMVFLREASAGSRSVSWKAIEIRAGQADLEVKPRAGGVEGAFELHIGDTVARTRPGAAERAVTRARRSGDGGSRIMVYEGEGEVTAAGRTVPIPSGMGIAVAPDGRTSGPEKLMPAPKLLTPNESESFDFSNPTFDWEPVPGARGYTVEVCRDTLCGQLVDRAVGVKLSRWTPRGLPIGVLYWRVSASGPTGLDSYVSPALKFAIRTYWRRPVEQP